MDEQDGLTRSRPDANASASRKIETNKAEPHGLGFTFGAHMPRRRRHTRRQSRPQMPRKLDQPVMMAAYIQDTPDWEKWRSRTVSLRHCLEMVAAGEAQQVTRQGKNGLVAFFQETKPTRASESSPTTLTMATMNAAAKSNERLTAGEKAHVLKFRVWPLIGDTRAVAVRPRISDAERRLAESLLSGKAA